MPGKAHFAGGKVERPRQGQIAANARHHRQADEADCALSPATFHLLPAGEADCALSPATFRLLPE